MTWCSGWFDWTWGHCCALHDIAYTMQFDKWEADYALAECVAGNGGWVVAAVMLGGVAAFGRPAYRKAKNYRPEKSDGEDV